MYKRKLINMVISATTAFIVLTLFCCVYYNVPVHSKNHDGATDYTWQSNKLYSSLTEGIGYGKTNNEGYMDNADYNGERINVLIMGSSHLQGLAIPQNDNCANQLSELLENKRVYNISIAGHNFKVCLSNLESALKKYNPEYLVIETSSITLSKEEIDNVINGTIPEIESVSNPVINFFQKNQFLRLMYSQIQSFSNASKNENNTTNEKTFDIESTNKLLEYIKNIKNKYNCNVIILYHPTVSLNNTKDIEINTDKSIDKFYDLCKENDLYFIDMTSKYYEEFKNTHTLPTGFINTGLAKGHLNSNGHKLFAQEIYKTIMELGQ